MVKKWLSSLGGKLVTHLLLASLLGVVVMYGSRYAFTYVISNWYAAPEVSSQRVEDKIEEFTDYVQDYNVAVSDLQKITRWSRENRYYQLIIYGESEELYRAEMEEPHYTSENAIPTPTLYTVPFADGNFQVAMYDYSAEQIYLAAELLVWILTFLVILVSMLLYNRRLTGSILRLSRQVRQVTQGDLTLPIQAPTRDEIGQLARDVDSMRLSIMDQLSREETAWQANAQLITAISHDVRTPLTSLLGYLDILSEEEELSPQMRKEYLEVCRQKADNLRDLTNELFGYFLVFGQPNPEMHLEDFQAITLLEQLMFEYFADLQQKGFAVETQGTLPENAIIRVDAQHLRRVFENLFSNIVKYADPSESVTVQLDFKDGNVVLTIVNRIQRSTALKESNRIGLRTCSKLISSMKGRFIQTRDDEYYTVELRLPVRKKKGT